jgi:hypothetical protein
MTARHIRELTRYLRADGPYPGAVHSEQGSFGRSFRELCLAVCLNDPQFGYNFVMSFVTSGRTIPPGVLDMNLRRAFYYFARNTNDDVMSEAYALVHPANAANQRILNALLLCRDMKLGQIAEVLSLPENAVSVYEQLWFNVRDRLGDKSFIASLVFPQTLFVSKEQDPEEDRDYAQALLRAAVKYGADEVLYMSGLTPSRSASVQVGKSAEEFEGLLMDAALTLVRHGRANDKTAPAIDRAKTLVAASKRAGQPDRLTDDIAGLGAIGAAESTLSNVARIQQQDISRRIACQQEQHAAAENTAEPGVLRGHEPI